MTAGSTRQKRVASALAVPIELGHLSNSLALDVQRRKRHLLLVAAGHLRGLLPSADCTRELLATLTSRIERNATRCKGAKGVNTKFIQRDPICDGIYRRLRGLPSKAPWPRAPDGTLMSRSHLETLVASNRWWIEAFEARRAAYAAETNKDLEAFRDLIVQPMPLAVLVRRHAPPIVAPARLLIGSDLRKASDGDLALLYRDSQRRLKVCRTALRHDNVERARKLAAIHRKRLGI